MNTVIPIQAVPSQTLTVLLSNQSCQLNIYQTNYGLFMDVYVNNGLIIGGVICENLNRIVRDAYLGFIGDFTFYDTQPPADFPGGEDPYYTGLGSRFELVYLDASDVSETG